MNVGRREGRKDLNALIRNLTLSLEGLGSHGKFLRKPVSDSACVLESSPWGLSGRWIRREGRGD